MAEAGADSRCPNAKPAPSEEVAELGSLAFRFLEAVFRHDGIRVRHSPVHHTGLVV